MKDILGFPPEVAALLVLLAVVYFLASWAPLWWPAVVAFRQRTPFPRRWLFVFVVASLSYGAFVFVLLGITLPGEAYAVFIAPQLEASGHPTGRPFLRVVDFIAQWWWVVLPPALLATTFFVTRKLLNKWSRICSALDG